jgi:DNA-binding XRE family transcriptional regulator
MTEPQIIHSPSGEEMVILSKADYDALLERLADADEEAEDIRIYDERKAALAAGSDQVLPAKVSELIHRGDSRLRAVRKWRGKNQETLANAVGISQPYLSALERNSRPLSEDLVTTIAEWLEVPKAWIEP